MSYTQLFLPASGKTAAGVAAGITYLSGAIVPEALGSRPDFGVLFSPSMGNTPSRLGAFACDNGVFGEFSSRGTRPFSLPRFVRLLEKWQHLADQALFGVAPDVIAPWQAELAGLRAREPWAASIERSLPILPRIRALGYKAAFVAQNGLEHHLNKIPWSAFDVLFLGGGREDRFVSKTNRQGEWKLTSGARRLVDLAKAKGKAVHMGRVNSGLRLGIAANWGCDSADGTFLGIAGHDNGLPQVLGWLDGLNAVAA